MSEGVYVAIIGGIVAIIVAVINNGRRIERAAKSSREHAAAVMDQVQNTHSTNLREDVDDLHDDVREVLTLARQHSEDIGDLRKQTDGLRREARLEREERMQLNERVNRCAMQDSRGASRPPTS